MASTFNTPLNTTTKTASRVGAGFGVRAFRATGPQAGCVGSAVAIGMFDGAAIGHEVYADARNLGALAARSAG